MLNLNLRDFIEATRIKDSIQADTGFCHILLTSTLSNSSNSRL